MNKKIVLITGASAGIGRAVAEQLSERGDIVYAGVRDMKRAQKDFEALLGRDTLKLVKLDVREKKHIAAVMKTIQKEHGRLDVLINNAGFGVYGAFEEIRDDDFRAQFETNFFGALAMMRAVLPLMREQKDGRILNVTSILGRMVIPTGSAYTSSKWALEAASEAIRYEMRPFNVRVTAIEPGLIRTNFKENTLFSEKRDDDNSPYAFLNRLMRTGYEGYYTPVDKCARKIIKIMDKNRPGIRYRVGLDAMMYNFIARNAPDWVIDMIFRVVVNRAVHRA